MPEVLPLSSGYRNGHIRSFPAQNVDAFSRLRVSTPGYRFDSQLTYQIDSDLWDTALTGGATISWKEIR